MKHRLISYIIAAFFAVSFFPSVALQAAPYAAVVMDARNGKIYHSRNADTRLHPASLTKMMTLYVAFQAIEKNEISLDSYVTVSRNAAAEPPSKLWLKRGQKIKLRYLIRAAAIKSANDAATAIAGPPAWRHHRLPRSPSCVLRASVYHPWSRPGGGYRRTSPTDG